MKRFPIIPVRVRTALLVQMLLLVLGLVAANSVLARGPQNAQGISGWTPGQAQSIAQIRALTALSRRWMAMVDGGVEIQVGPGGHFQSLNEALALASSLRHRHNSDRDGVVVRILNGYVLDEQIHQYNSDLSHVRITADEIVPVNTSSFVGADDDRGSAPLFNVQRGSESPKIDSIFEQIDGGAAVGLLVNRGSRAVITPNGGFIGFRDGATINNGSTLSARFSTLRGSRWGVHARHMSDATLRSADMTGGEIAAWARRASRIDVRGADLSGDGGEGIRADNVSLVEAHGAQIAGRAIAANAFRGGQINLLGVSFGDSVTAMRVTEGGFIYAHGLAPADLSEVTVPFSTEPNSFSADGVIFTNLDLSTVAVDE
ncbi:MAG: hypothetical protein EA400_04975 [Chromatiaceae bacterium]|nr:MAG: hypothetical protein EA400_04975 [Chromatiaceae bacterium]